MELLEFTNALKAKGISIRESIVLLCTKGAYDALFNGEYKVTFIMSEIIELNNKAFYLNQIDDIANEIINFK